ncbi:MAG: ABC transporter substrate-binding protein [Thalassotalea sp.]
MSKNFQLQLVCLLLLCSFTASVFCLELKPDSPFITVQLNKDPAVREIFLPLFKAFESETGIKVIPLRYIHDEEFKQYVTKSHDGSLPLPDVLNGLNSERLLSIVRQGMVHPVTHLWAEHNWADVFPSTIRSWLTYKNNIYALPYTQYSWGIFFNKSLVKKFGPVPQHWPQFIHYCETIKKSGMEVFPASYKQPWIASAWFEYITLRTYGFSFFQEVMAGNVSYHDPRIQAVLLIWKSMIDKGLFSTKYKSYLWEGYLPQFLRNNFAFIFMGTSLARRIYDPVMLQNTEFMAFPKIADIPFDETSPVSLFFISSKSHKIKSAEQFLTFFARPTVQTQIAAHLYSMPMVKNAEVPNNNIIQSGAAILAKAHHLSPFFDRDIKDDFAHQVLPALAEFLFSGNIEALTRTLENNRLKFYPPTTSK